MTDNPLYQSLLQRRSIRRYNAKHLDQADLDKVNDSINAIHPFLSHINVNIQLLNTGQELDLVKLVGAYGHLVTPPHALLPTSPDEPFALVEQGYRMQQIVIHLYEQGIGSCYLGSLGRQSQIQSRFGLPNSNITGALLALGYPAQSSPGRTFNTLFRTAIGSNKRLPLEDIFFSGSFDNRTTPPEHLQPLIQAARFAPSAVNAQPWRFLLLDNTLYLFVTRKNKKYGISGQNYALFDGGICMANITLAMHALGINGRWQPLEETDADTLACPQNLKPLAKQTLN